MDLGDFLRSFLGLDGKNRNRSDFPQIPTEDEDDDYDSFSIIDDDKDKSNTFHFFFGNGGGEHSMDEMFRHFHGDMHRQMESLHQQMEDMLRGFGTIRSDNLPPGHRPSFPDTPQSEPKNRSDKPIFFHPVQPYARADKNNPRDFMLKDDKDSQAPKSVLPETPTEGASKSFSMPFRGLFPWNRPLSQERKAEDTDLDGKISSADAADIIRKSNEEALPAQRSPRRPNGIITGSSVCVTTTTGPNGKTEHTRVVRDASGREENTVTRSVDGQCHTITTITGPDGLQERREDFKNMDENDIKKFQEKWNSDPNSQTLPSPPMLGPPNPSIFGPSSRLDPRDMNLFTKLFGPPAK